MRCPNRLALVALALLAAGCGQQPVSTARPSPPPKRALVAIADGTGLRLVDLHGRTVAQTALLRAEPVGAAGDFAAFVAGTDLKALHADGTVTTLESLPGVQSSTLVVGPDGRQWLWAAWTINGPAVSSRVVLSSAGRPDRTVAQHDGATDHRALYPFRWTPAGPVYFSGPVGIGGYILFYTGFSPGWLVDPTSAQLTPLRGGSCAVADVAEDRTVACFEPPAAGPAALAITRPDGRTVRVQLPRPQFFEFGAASFRPGPTAVTLVVAGSPANGAPREEYEMDLVDVATGARRPFGPAGLRPGDGSWVWLSDGSLIAYRPDGTLGGDPGVYLLAPDGGATRVFGSGRPIGVIHV